MDSSGAQRTADARTVDEVVKQTLAADRAQKQERCERLEREIAALQEQYQDAVSEIKAEIRPIERRASHRSPQSETGQRLQEEVPALQRQLREERRQFRREYRELTRALQEAEHELAMVAEEQETVQELVSEVLR